MDGATPRQQFFHITLPLLTPGHRHQPVPAADRRPAGLRPALHPDQGRARLRHQHHHPVDHHQRRRAGPLRPGVGAVGAVHLVGGRAGRRTAPRLPPAGKARLVNNVKERTSPLTAVIMIPVALIVALPLYYIVVNTFKTQEEMVELTVRPADPAVPRQLRHGVRHRAPGAELRQHPFRHRGVAGC